MEIQEVYVKEQIFLMFSHSILEGCGKKPNPGPQKFTEHFL